MTARRAPADAERTALWDTTHARRDWSATPLEQRYDVVVVGAGLVGLATAIELARRDCSVAVLEARHVGAEASGRTTAKTSLLQGTRLSRLVSRHGSDLAGQYLAGNRAGQDWVRGLAGELGVAVRTGTRVTEVHGDGDTVVTEAGNVEAPHVVLATGSPVSDRGGFFARLEPERSYLTSYRGPEAFPTGMYLSAGSPTRSLRTVPGPDGDVLLVGGNNHVVGRTESEAHEAQDLVDWTLRHFPDASPQHRWSAQDFHTFELPPARLALRPRRHRPGRAGGLAARHRRVTVRRRGRARWGRAGIRLRQPEAGPTRTGPARPRLSRAERV